MPDSLKRTKSSVKTTKCTSTDAKKDDICEKIVPDAVSTEVPDTVPTEVPDTVPTEVPDTVPTVVPKLKLESKKCIE